MRDLKPVASGRACQVFDAGEGRVLRRYRYEASALDEAALMQYLDAKGYPVPEVYEVRGPDILMERIDGQTMLDALMRRPWKLRFFANTLATLHRQLEEIEPPGWFESRLGPPESVAHLDLHPDNVMLSTNGPVVIDWTNAMAGPRGVDAAMTWILLQSGQPPGGWVVRKTVGMMRRRFLDVFLAAVDEEQAREQLARAAERRLADPNLLDEERAAIQRMLA